ncbi:MAG: hypothetical protein ABJG41_16805 [Cyclobacteriaceae bacterium]
MKLSQFSILAIFFAVILSACSDDSGVVTVSFTEGTPIYGDMNAIRQVPLKGMSREIENPGKIFVAPSFLLVGEEELGIHVLDNTDPANPTPSAFINIPGNKEFYFANNIIYAESYYDMLKIDITNPSNPILINRSIEALGEEIRNTQGESLLGFTFKDVTKRITKDEDVYDYIYGGENYYVLYDYAENLIPPSAVPASFAGNSNGQIGSVNRVVAYQNHVYVISRSKLRVFDDQNDFDLIYSDWFSSNMETIFPMQNYLFIGGRDQVSIVDITEPSMPQHLSSFWHATSCDPVYPAENNRAYVTLRTGDFAECPGDVNALILLNIDEISSPYEIQEIEMKSPFGLRKIGDKLYVGEGENGLKIFDASNPDQLRLEKWEMNIPAFDILEHPTQPSIILIAAPNGLAQYIVGDDFHLISEVAY